MPEEITDIERAVERGIKGALSDPETVRAFWDGAFKVLNHEAQKRTGEFVIGSFRELLKKGMLFMILGLVVYNLGGWGAIVALWKSLSAH